MGSGIHARIGGVARYYHTDLEENHAISTEITGYAASTLVYLHSLTGEPLYLDRAVQAARFLTRMAWDRHLGIFPCEYDVHAPVEPLAYFFDSGIIARGLLAVWRATGESEFLDAAIECGRGMARDFHAGGAEFHPILNLPSKQPVDRDCRWSRSPGCYQLKSALAWCELAEEAGQEELLPYYEALLEDSLRSHSSFLPGDSEPDRVMDRLHAHCYFLEGLLPVLDRKRCATAAADGLARVSALLREIAPRFERSDVSAQLLRFRIFAELAGALPVDNLAAESEARNLASFQTDHFNTRITGGFYFGRKGGSLLPYVNPVSTAFGLQALAMWEARRNGTLSIRRQMLI